MTYAQALTSLMAGVLALSLGLAACGGGSASDTKSAPATEIDEVEEATEDAADKEAFDTDAATTDDEHEVDPENVDPDEEIAKDALRWTDAWMGEGGSGEYYFFAESPDGGEGIMIVLDPHSKAYVSFAGTNATDEETGHITLTDEASDLALTYEVLSVTGDVVTIDLGEYGTAKLQSCDIDDVLDAFVAIYEGGTNALATAEDAEGLERNLRILTSGWEAAWMGGSTSGEHYFYAEAPEDKADALMLIVDPGNMEYVSFVGSTTYDEETGCLETTDDSTGLSITYEVVDATGNGVIIDVGDYDQVALDSCTMDEFIEAFVAVVENCTPNNSDLGRAHR